MTISEGWSDSVIVKDAVFTGFEPGSCDLCVVYVYNFVWGIETDLGLHIHAFGCNLKFPMSPGYLKFYSFVPPEPPQ